MQGGTIGTGKLLGETECEQEADLQFSGLFLGTGRSLATGGPASLLINYSIVGVIVCLVMLCLGYVLFLAPSSLILTFR